MKGMVRALVLHALGRPAHVHNLLAPCVPAFSRRLRARRGCLLQLDGAICCLVQVRHATYAPATAAWPHAELRVHFAAGELQLVRALGWPEVPEVRDVALRSQVPRVEHVAYGAILTLLHVAARLELVGPLGRGTRPSVVPVRCCVPRRQHRRAIHGTLKRQARRALTLAMHVAAVGRPAVAV